MLVVCRVLASLLVVIVAHDLLLFFLLTGQYRRFGVSAAVITALGIGIWTL